MRRLAALLRFCSRWRGGGEEVGEHLPEHRCVAREVSFEAGEGAGADPDIASHLSNPGLFLGAEEAKRFS
jgi:hypothetical protein